MPDLYRVIVTGSRAYRGSDVGREISLLVMEHGENLVVVHGDCPSGADKLASIACRALGIREEPHPAGWHAPCRPECKPGHRRREPGGLTKCPAAGPYRNQEMVDAGASLTLAFFAEGEPNRGTLDCVRRAIAAGIPVMRRGALVVEGVDVP